MAVERTDEGRQEQHTALKRRGLIAGAAAVMVGVLAKQTAAPVGATGGGTNGMALIIGANSISPNTPNTFTDTTTLRPASGSTVASGYNVPGTALIAIGQDANSFSASNSGLAGVCYGFSSAGVYGESTTGRGVYGFINGGPNGGSGIGVHGDANTATLAYGVYGQANGTGSMGVYGTASSTAPAVFGTNLAIGASAGPGTQGTSNLGHGAVGVSGASDGHASVYAYSNQQGGIAVRGSIDPKVRNAPFTFAGVFDGTVSVSGNLYIGGSKSAYVPHPTDGSHRVLYCMESPESWFEDFGQGTLAGGKADIKLDPDFAMLVHADDYHVFLTSHDPASKGLAVAGRNPDGFIVQEHGGGTSGGTFSYRVVAKRKDIVGERLATFTPPPELKPVTPFTLPATPEVKPPLKKP